MVNVLKCMSNWKKSDKVKFNILNQYLGNKCYVLNRLSSFWWQKINRLN